MEIVPAIDIINGKAVRLTHGDYNTAKVYYENPVEAAMLFENAGIKRLHLVDLDGAKAGKISNIAVLKKIAKETKLQIDFGGGVKIENDVNEVLDNGAAMVTLGSIAATNPEIVYTWINKFGADKLFIGADVKEKKLKIKGWQEDAGIGLFSFITTLISKGAKEFFCTDISKDGALQGPSILLYQEIIAQFPGISLTASGGISGIDDLYALKKIGCAGAIVGKAFYEGKLSIAEMQNFMNEK